MSCDADSHGILLRQTHGTHVVGDSIRRTQQTVTGCLHSWPCHASSLEAQHSSRAHFLASHLFMAAPADLCQFGGDLAISTGSCLVFGIRTLRNGRSLVQWKVG